MNSIGQAKGAGTAAGPARSRTGGLIAWLLVAAACPWAQSGTAAAAPDLAQVVLERADRIRFPASDFQVDVTITTTEDRGDPDVRAYRILSKGNDRTLVQATAPAIDRGQILLMRDRDLWAFLPNISQPIRLPLSQKLTGQVANGDLARANFVGDYLPEILRRERIANNDYYVLELQAARRGVTYHRVLYWVHTRNHRPHKAEFYALSGRLLKVGYYQEFAALGGQTRPTRLVIEDALRSNRRSVMDYRNMRLRKLPAKYFSKNYLKKLSR